MNETARAQILTAMRAALKDSPSTPSLAAGVAPKGRSQQEKVELLKKNLESVRSEVYVVQKQNWVETLLQLTAAKQIKSLLFSPQVGMGSELEAAFLKRSDIQTGLIAYQEKIETFKPRLFEIDAAVTTAKGAIAENGALILWPDPHEPRLASLVPPIHIVILDADTLFDSFAEAMEKGKWADGMPTNLVLISGPSKTADIELVLAFGVHGPKELVVLIINE